MSIAWIKYTVFAVAALAFGFFGNEFFNIESASAITPSWTAGVDLGGDYTVPILEYNSGRSEFALAYATIAGSALKFTTSSVGAAWSTPVAISSHADGVLTTLPMLTVDANNSYYAGTFSSSAGIFASTANSGLTWSTSTPPGLDRFYNSASMAIKGIQILVGGSVSGSGISGYWTTNSLTGATFTSSSVSGSAASQGMMTANSTLVAGVYTISGDATHLYVITSSDGTTFETTTLTVSDSSGITSPRIAIDSNGRMWLAYYVNVGGTYYIETATFKTGDAGSCIWIQERIDTAGTVSPNSLDIAFLNGATPIISYYYKLGGTINLRYAARDNGNSGCSASGGSKWSCANIVTSMSGNDFLSIATNGSGKAVIVYQNSTAKAAYADFLGTSYDYSCSQSSSSNSYNLKSLIKPIFVGSDSVVINGGAAKTSSRQVDVMFNVKNATEFAVSLNSGMFGAIWQPWVKQKTITLPNQSGAHTVFAKFTNPTGAVSEMASSTIIYEPVVEVPAPSPVSPQPAPIVVAPPAPVILDPPSAQAPTSPEELGVEPFFDPVETLAKVMMLEQKKKIEGYLCSERPNAFSVGGQVVRDLTSGKRYVMFKSQGVVCPVVSNAVLASWGVRTVATVANVTGLRVSSPLPYRPGTVVRARENSALYFVNPQGRLHQFGSAKVFSALGYRSSLVRVESRATINMFAPAVTLTRTDIHPDGTLFITNEKTGLYAVLHGRVLHPINKKTLQLYGENIARAVRFRVGETYETGDSWSK